MKPHHGYVELQQLRYVVEVADLSSFTRAAERCHVTQSALSHQIAALEREIGLPLFVRTSRSVRVTEAGEVFVRHARAALSAAQSAVQEAAATSGQVVGTLRLGVIPTVTAVAVPQLIAEFRSAHPATRVELRIGNSDALMGDVRDGLLDVALLGLRSEVEPRGAASRRIASGRLAAVVPCGHRLAHRSVISLADLAGEVFADFPAGTSGRSQSDAAFSRANVPRDVAFEADTPDLLLGLVAAGLAVTLLAPGVVSAARDDIVVLNVRDGPGRAEHVAWDDRAPRAVTRAFLAVLDRMLLPRDDEEAGPGITPEPASDQPEITSRRRRPSPSTS